MIKVDGVLLKCENSDLNVNISLKIFNFFNPFVNFCLACFGMNHGEGMSYIMWIFSQMPLILKVTTNLILK